MIRCWGFSDLDLTRASRVYHDESSGGFHEVDLPALIAEHLARPPWPHTPG